MNYIDFWTYICSISTYVAKECEKKKESREYAIKIKQKFLSLRGCNTASYNFRRNSEGVRKKRLLHKC